MMSSHFNGNHYPYHELEGNNSPVSQVSKNSAHSQNSLPIDPDLLGLADTERALTREEITRTLAHVPLLVLVEDEPMIRSVMVRCLKNVRENIASLENNDLRHSFDAIASMDRDTLPVVLCRDGNEFESALQNIPVYGFDRGLIIADDIMPGKRGLDTLSEYQNIIPRRFARVLQSGYVGSGNPNEALERGIIDFFVQKPFNPNICGDYMKAFLRHQR